MRAALAQCLGRANHELIEVGADTAPDELIKNAKPGIVVVGLELVNDADLDLCRKLSAIPCAPGLVVVSPDFVNSAKRVEALNAGADACLAEILPLELLAHVQSLFRRARRNYLEQDLEKAGQDASTGGKLFHKMFDLAAVGLVQVDPSSGRLLRVNRKYCEITGYSENELLKMSVYELTDPAIRDQDWECYQAAVRGETRDYHQEKQYLRKDGTLIWVDVNAVLVRDRTGRPLWSLAVIRDITVRKLAEMTLAASKLALDRVNADLERKVDERTRELEAERARWQQVVKGIADEVWLCDTQSRFTLVNRQEVTDIGLKQFTDMPLSEILERIEILEPDGAPRAVERTPMLRSLAGETVRGEELIRHRATGRTRWRQFSSAPVRDSSGTILGAIAIISDITERKHNEELLRFTQFSIENASDAIFWSGLDARICFVNAAGCQLLGYSREELLELSVHDLEPGRPRDEWTMDCARLKEVKSLRFESKVRRKDGSFVPVEITINHLEFGGKEHHCAFIRDITQRKKSEETLRKLSLAAEHTSAGIIITDLHGVIEYANPRYCFMIGYQPEEVIGQNPRIFKSGHTPPGEYQRLWQTILAGADWKGELLNRKKSGELFWERATISPIKQPGGNITHFVAVKEDVTAQKRAEDALLMSRQELRALAGRLQAVREQERTRLAREIHDVLAQELSFLKMEISSFKFRLSQAGQDVFALRLKDMDQAVDRAVASVQEIATALRPVILDSLGLCAAVEWQVREFEARSGISCKVSVPGSALPLDHERSTALFRLLQESLTNVLRHSEARRVEVSLTWESGVVALRVQDNGRGIPESKLNAPRSIGLIGMRERAYLLGGQCQITSKPGEGALIEARFDLPAPSDNGQG